MMVILSITEAGCNLYYWGQSYVYDQIGYEFGVNCFFSGIFEGLAYLVLSTPLLTRPDHLKTAKEKVSTDPLHTAGADRIPLLLLNHSGEFNRVDSCARNPSVYFKVYLT